MTTRGRPRSALVLGGGFAGLSAAIHLAAAGVDVTVIEAQETVGGKAGRIEGEGFRFDTGPTVLTLPHVLHETFAAGGADVPFRLEPVEPLCRYRFPSGRTLDLHRDAGRTLRALEPREAAAYTGLLETARRMYEGAAPTFLYGPPPSPVALATYGLRHGLAAHPTRSLVDLVRRFDPGPDLERVFLRFATYFGANPYRAPAILHNIAWAELGLGVVYPEGGMRRVVEELERLALRLGARIETNRPVERIDVRSGRVQSVVAGGREYRADAVVSTIDVVRTHRLLGRTSPLERLEPSLSGFVLLLGIGGVTPGLAHHTILFPDDYRAEWDAIQSGRLPDDPTVYVTIGSRTDASQAPEGAENWFVMTNAPPLPEDGRDDGGDRTLQATERALAALERHGFRTEGRVRFRHALPPEHLARFGHRGSIYGVAPHSLLRTLRPAPGVRGVRNLVLAGGTVHPGGGVPLALLGGRTAARRVLALEPR